MNEHKSPPPTPRAAAPAAPGPALGFWREAGQILLLFVVSATVLAWVFPPRGLWPLAFVCLVPWAVATCRAQRAWLVHWLSFFVGWGFFLVTLRWLYPVTDLGYAALALYLAIYWTLAAWAIRTARRHHISPVWSLPVVWVACEFLRAHVLTGFPWLFLSHALYRQLTLIQISDITGAYGVSFLIALVNGVLVEAALRRWPAPGPPSSGRQLLAGAAVAVGVLVATLGYGVLRLRQVDLTSSAAVRGPRVAVVQHDFPLVSTYPYSDHAYVVLASYLAMAAEAVRAQPDLVVFPETVWSAYQNLEFIEKRELVPEAPHGSWDWSFTCHQAVSAFSRGDYAAVNRVLTDLEQRLPQIAQRRPRSKVPTSLPRLLAEAGLPVTTVVGAVSLEQFPEATYPKVKRFNSALIYDPNGTQRPERYDKNHLVPFGEFVPFRRATLLGFDLHWLYRWLNSLSPFSEGGTEEYSLTPGTELTVFPLSTPEGTFRFGTPICYEDATPDLVRRYVWDGPRRRVDFLVNISNDGWFQHSVELAQHLAICAFRAVENRVAIARAVNTGISGFIDSNGRIYSVVRDEKGRMDAPGVVGFALEAVPLDQRGSLYGQFGDGLAGTCLVLALLLWLGAVFERWVLAIRHRVLGLLGRKRRA